jgi:long-chain acyl-CoA synthetase
VNVTLAAQLLIICHLGNPIAYQSFLLLLLCNRNGEDSYISYLPLAHILELMAEFIMISRGCTICYADPKSLTSTGSHPIGALEHYSPTLMASVPKIWDVIKKGISAKVAQSSPIAQFLVQTAFEARSFALMNGYDTPLFNALVFKKFKAVVGGKLRFGLSGGGPLNGEVQDFIRTCFGMIFVQGYVSRHTMMNKRHRQSLSSLAVFSIAMTGFD